MRPTRRWLPIGALAAAAILLLGLDLNSLNELRDAEGERAEYALIAQKVSHGGRNWYMVGLDQWQGSGGGLFAPGKPDLAPFVVFHHPPSLAGGAKNTIWVFDTDGYWVCGVNFGPDDDPCQFG